MNKEDSGFIFWVFFLLKGEMMILDTANTNDSINVHTNNIDNLTYEQAYGLPVKDNDGSIIGFVSDVDEKYIYMHIFNKNTLNIVQNPTSVELINM